MTSTHASALGDDVVVRNSAKAGDDVPQAVRRAPAAARKQLADVTHVLAEVDAVVGAVDAVRRRSDPALRNRPVKQPCVRIVQLVIIVSRPVATPGV